MSDSVPNDSSETVDAQELMQEQLHSLKKLISSEGWKLLTGLVDEQAEVRSSQILVMELTGIESVMEIQRLKSERNGLRLFKVLPETMIEQLEEDLNDE